MANGQVVGTLLYAKSEMCSHYLWSQIFANVSINLEITTQQGSNKNLMKFYHKNLFTRLQLDSNPEPFSS